MKKILSLALAAAVLTAPGCSFFKKEASTVKTDLIDCAALTASQSGGVAEAILTITGTFIQAVDTGNYGTAVSELVANYGVPMVACTIHALEKQLQPAPADAGAAPSTAAQDPYAAAAHDVVQTNGWQFK